MRILGSGSMYFRAYGCSRGSTVLLVEMCVSGWDFRLCLGLGD